MKKSGLLTCWLITMAGVAAAQSVAGRVYDAINREGLPGATIEVADAGKGTATDEEGYFKLEHLDPGRYNLRVSYVGYETQVVPGVWVRNGKVTGQDFAMKRDYTGLDEVVIEDRLNPVEIGRLTITEEQINRFAATYYDPARLLTTSPDVVVTNDQNNRISVRGISPNYNVWRLEGAEIVNPNHMSNAGTFSDQPTATGGGVNILSAQMLDKSRFLYGGFQNQYGNSVGGLFDMNFRRGNAEDRQYTAQASLIGLDFSAEGPFSRNADASYLVNYRYSFTGLLAQMGVDFGGESIGFQDLSVNVNIPLKGHSALTLFAVGGLNYNNFDARTLEESEVQKDRSDIYYDGKMGAVGASFRHDLGGNGYGMHTIAVSSNDNRRQQNVYDDDQALLTYFNTNSENTIISLNTRYTLGVGRGSITYGAMLNRYDYENGTAVPNQPPGDYSLEQFLINPYASFTYPVFSGLEADLGLSYYHNGGRDQALDPRIGLTWLAGANTEIYAKAGRYSQLLNPYNYYFVYLLNGGDYVALKEHFGFQRSNRFNAGINQQWLNWNFGLEGFYYSFPEVNIGDTELSTSTAATRGISLTANKSYTNGWYLNGGGSLFDAVWDLEGAEKDNRYNTRYNLSLSSGKEWTFSGKQKKRSLSVNGRLMYQGGLQEPVYEIQPPISSEAGRSVTTDNADFLRLDLRIQWTRHRENRTASVALDLQNATGRQNEAYQYADYFTGSVETQYQLGLIPILTYRVEW